MKNLKTGSLNLDNIYNDFAKEYPHIVENWDVNNVLFRKIVFAFGNIIIEEILKGYKFSIDLLGSVEIIKVIRRQTLQIDFGSTQKARKENPNAKIVYRTNRHFYCFNWWRAPVKGLDHYMFKPIRQDELSIPLYEKYNEFKVERNMTVVNKLK